MSARIVGPRLKVLRAREHLAQLEARHRYFMNPHPYYIEQECEIKTRQQVSRLRIVKTIPHDWGLIVGDVFHNLRSSLDLLAWQLVLANGGTPDKTTEFPIGKSQDAWEHGRGGVRVLTAIDPDAMAVLCRLKPYQGGNDALWAVHSLNIEDKHHLLVPMCTANTTTILQLGLNPDPVILSHDLPDMPPPVPLEDGAIVARQPAETADDVKFSFAIDVTFREAPLAGKELLRTLHELVRQVDGVLDAFNALRWPDDPPDHDPSPA